MLEKGLTTMKLNYEILLKRVWRQKNVTPFSHFKHPEVVLAIERKIKEQGKIIIDEAPER